MVLIYAKILLVSTIVRSMFDFLTNFKHPCYVPIRYGGSYISQIILSKDCRATNFPVTFIAVST